MVKTCFCDGVSAQHCVGSPLEYWGKCGCDCHDRPVLERGFCQTLQDLYPISDEAGVFALIEHLDNCPRCWHVQDEHAAECVRELDEQREADEADDYMLSRIPGAAKGA